jgi:hypothetical protein
MAALQLAATGMPEPPRRRKAVASRNTTMPTPTMMTEKTPAGDHPQAMYLVMGSIVRVLLPVVPEETLSETGSR